MTNPDRDRLLDRIRKVLALTTSDQEGERFAALNRVQVMLAEHNMTMEEITEARDDMTMDQLSTSMAEPWRRSVGTMIGQLYFCVYFYHGTEGGQDAHYMAGEKHNVVVARLMFFYVCETIDRLADEAAKAIRLRKRDEYRKTFVEACAVRVCARIKERIDEARCGTATDWHGNNLPVLASEYDRKLLAAKNFMDQQYGMSEGAKTERHLPTITDPHGLQAGLAAGDQVGLEPQVGNDVPKRLKSGPNKRTSVLKDGKFIPKGY